jgi:hypothetical protein
MLGQSQFNWLIIKKLVDCHCHQKYFFFHNFYRSTNIFPMHSIKFGQMFDWGWNIFRFNKFTNYNFTKFLFIKDYDLIFTGHSLGGALASLAAAQTRVEGLRRSEQITLYTFGQPRIGNYEFAMAHSLQIPNRWLMK